MTEGHGSVRILLADEQSLFREAVRAVLESEPDLCVVADVSDGIHAITEADRTQPDVALLHAVLPNRSGISAAEVIKERVPGCRVLILTDQEDQTALTAALEAGANGYLTKESALGELIDAVRAIHRGETLVPARMLGRLFDRLIHHRREQDEAWRLVSRLTQREREVLVLLAGGAGNATIAQSLLISPQTARTHIQNILGKLAVHSRLEAAAFVRQNRLLRELRNVAPGSVLL